MFSKKAAATFAIMGAIIAFSAKLPELGATTGGWHCNHDKVYTCPCHNHLNGTDSLRDCKTIQKQGSLDLANIYDCDEKGKAECPFPMPLVDCVDCKQYNAKCPSTNAMVVGGGSFGGVATCDDSAAP